MVETFPLLDLPAVAVFWLCGSVSILFRPTLPAP
jgi:hypothetical protein